MRLARSASDAWIDLLGSVSPRAACNWAAAERRLTRRLRGSGPGIDEVARFFALDPAAASAVARDMASSIGRNRVLRRLAIQRGVDVLTPWIEPAAVARVAEVLTPGSSVILVVAPLGPRVAVATVLHRLGITALLVANLPRQPYASWGLTVHAPAATPGQGGGPALKAAVDHLRQGGVVVAANEGREGPVVAERPFLGGRLALRPGIAAMARLGRAPVIPIATRWTEGYRSIDVALGPPLRSNTEAMEGGPADEPMMTQLCEGIEELVRATPGQCDLRFLRLCLTLGS